MTSTLIVRPASEGDLHAIWHVHTRAIATTCRSHYADAVIAAWVERLKPESYRSVLKRAMVFLAEDESGVVGFGQIDLAAAEVQAVYVLPDAQGRGIGAVLLARLEAAAAEGGLSHITLKATLNAEPFYRAHGWHATSNDVHKITEQIAVACVSMEKPIAAATPLPA